MRKVKLPSVFKTPLRPDVVKRGVVTLQSHRFQAQGRDRMAGKRTTAESKGVGLGIARVPRLKTSMRAAFGVGIVGGHRAHPPRSEKKVKKRIPRKELNLALRSSIAASSLKDVVKKRGHVVEDVPDFPLVVIDEIEELHRTKDVETLLLALGVWGDVFRVRRVERYAQGRGKEEDDGISRVLGL